MRIEILRAYIKGASTLVEHVKDTIEKIAARLNGQPADEDTPELNDQVFTALLVSFFAKANVEAANAAHAGGIESSDFLECSLAMINEFANRKNNEQEEPKQEAPVESAQPTLH